MTEATAASRCFHCGAAVPAGASGARVVDGETRAFCSAGCLEVAGTILADGLGEFYRYRAGPSTAPAGRDRAADRWACYDRPALQKEFVLEQADGTRRAQLLLGGVRCAACVWLIERAMAPVAGVRHIAVDPVTGRTELHWDPRTARLSSLLARLGALGYSPCPYAEDATGQAAVRERRAALRRLIVAGLGMMQVGSYAIALYAGAFLSMDPEIEFFLRMISLVVATPVVFYAGSPFFTGAWRNLRSRTLGMEVPVALAISGAWGASVWNTFTGSGEVYFDSATMFVFLLGIARYLEMAGRHTALSLTGALAQHMPRVATRVNPDGSLEEVGVMELVAGDTVLVAPGRAVPADGVLAQGEARLDESLLTGESVPVLRRAGDSVLAGSLNLLQAVRIRVRQVGAETVLAHISQLTAAAGQEKPRLVRLADRVAVGFVSRLLVVTAGVAAYWLYAAPDRAFEIVLSVLVVTCPCALAIATPAVYTVTMSALARRGFLVRRPAALEALAKTSHVVFDKTGTLTEPGATLEQVRTFGRLDAPAATELAAQLESFSEHPLARAFPAPARISPDARATAVPGRGLEGWLDGRRYRIGRLDFALELVAAAAGETEPAAVSGPTDSRTVYLSDETGLLACFELGEKLRPGAARAVADLIDGGLEPLIASGDDAGAVAAMAGRLGITGWRADLRPDDKLAFLRAVQQSGGVVAMVGDGINDSPVLAGADVSIAMGSGTALAQHAADCVLINPSLATLGFAVRTARRAQRTVRQNFTWAICYNFSAIPLAAMGLIEPWMAAIGMSASSLLVTANALRLGRGLKPAGVPVMTATTTGTLTPSAAATP